MLWDDPWIAAALSEGGTDLPPLPVTLPPDLVFSCAPASEQLCDEWIAVVGTVWSLEQLAERLADTWICMVRTRGKGQGQGNLVATCVLRPRAHIWFIETLVSRQRGCGSLLIRAMGPWLWKHVGGRFTLGYSWELTSSQLLYAWWRGWLRTATSIEYGWVLRLDNSCKFCPLLKDKQKPTKTMPFLVQTAAGSAVITDSGLGDGWGYVLKQTGSPDWQLIHKRFGFHSLWCSSSDPPLTERLSWQWTGEFIVTGFLNKRIGDPDYGDWITAEVAFAPQLD
jgi:hypothetical protein